MAHNIARHDSRAKSWSHASETKSFELHLNLTGIERNSQNDTIIIRLKC